jgi:hypothetical protein
MGGYCKKCPRRADDMLLVGATVINDDDDDDVDIDIVEDVVDVGGIVDVVGIVDVAGTMSREGTDRCCLSLVCPCRPRDLVIMVALFKVGFADCDDGAADLRCRIRGRLRDDWSGASWRL